MSIRSSRSPLAKTEGSEVYARVGEEPFIVAVNQQLLGEIWADPLRWQELAIFKFKPTTSSISRA